jgi:hypothetical protein
LCTAPPVLGQGFPDGNSKISPDFSHSLVYVSDYFSFIGVDDQGHVAFALDNNRGRDDDSYQAEHFVVLHDEHNGWVDIQGNGAYDNPSHLLKSIPDSAFFEFQGIPEIGITITSQPNDLRLVVKPIPTRLSNTHEGGHYWMGSAPATLIWGDRTIQGRVIYEYLMMPNFNRLSRTYWKLWKEFQGFYVSIERLGDLYIHSQESELIAPLIGNLDGFLAAQETTHTFQILQLTPINQTQGYGFYKWPTDWVIRLMTKDGTGEGHLTMSHQNRISNWVLGGFSMGIIQGEITYQGNSYPVYGLAELIM